MAKLWIHQFRHLSQRPSGAQIAPLNGVVAKQELTFSTSTDSDAMGDTTRFVRLRSDTNCHVVIGGPAVTSDLPLSANSPEYFAVDPGDVISVIAAA